MKRARESNPPMNSRKGFFLTPGNSPEKITLLGNNRIVFKDQKGNSTPEHGSWHEWITTDGTQMLLLTFHHRGSEVDKDLMPHVFRCFVPGDYRMQNRKQKKDIDFEVKNVYMWLHPERPPAVLLITPSFQFVYHESKEGAKRPRTCQMAPASITTCFHWQGKPTTQKTVLSRIAENKPVWRAVGDENKGCYENLSELSHWHIVIDRNVQFLPPDS